MRQLASGLDRIILGQTILISLSYSTTLCNHSYLHIYIHIFVFISNVSQRLYRRRRTQEAARFAAVIEAIRVARSCGKNGQLYAQIVWHFCNNLFRP